FMSRQHPSSTLFPYTTLFRSNILVNQGDEVTEGTLLIELTAEDDASNVVESQKADATQKTSENTPTSLPDQEIMQELASHQPKTDRKSTRLNSSHVKISYAVF